MINYHRFLTSVLLAMLLVSANLGAAPVSSAFTYQGELSQGDGPANGFFDLEFHIFDVVTGGIDLVPEALFDGVEVTNGIFSVELDFGDAPFDGNALWLEIRVRENGASGMTILEPRQPVSPTPYALQALMVNTNSINSTNIVNNSIAAADIATDAVGAGELADGAVDPAAMALPMHLRAENTGNVELIQSGVLSVVNSAPSTPSDTASPYGIVGSVEYSSGTPSPLFLPPAGVLGQADAPNGTGIGVIGMSGDYGNLGWPSRAGVYGLSVLAVGVSGRSGSGTGVQGSSSNSFGGSFTGTTGVRATGTSTNSGYGGDFSGNTGLRATGTGSLRYGVESTSTQYRGLFAESTTGIFFDGYFGAGGGISSNGIINRSGSAKILAINLGEATINVGDLVALAGVDVNPETGKPVLGVAAVDSSNAHAVIGVADQAISLGSVKRESGDLKYDFAPTDGDVGADNYLAVITAGLAGRVNISDSNKSAVPAIGSKLSLNIAGGMQKYSGLSDEVVVGKIAGEFDPETSTVPVFIDID